MLLQDKSCSMCYSQHFTKLSMFSNSPHLEKPIIICENCHSNIMNISYNSQYKDNCYCNRYPSYTEETDSLKFCHYCERCIHYVLPPFQLWDSCQYCDDPVYHNTCDCQFFHDIFVKELESSTGDEFNRLYEAIKSDKKGHHRKQKDTSYIKDALRDKYIRTISSTPVCYSSHRIYLWNSYLDTNYQKLFVKCDKCSNNAIFNSNEDEFLCYECNHKIAVYLTKKKHYNLKIVSKERYTKRKTEKESRYNSCKRVRKKTSMKKLYDLHYLDDYPIKFSQMTRDTVIIQPNERKRTLNRSPIKQKVPAYWNKEINTHTKWVNIVTESQFNIYEYESMFPKLLTCSICFTGTSNRTKCGHVMHNECLKIWLRKKSTCPECRTKLI